MDDEFIKPEEEEAESILDGEAESLDKLKDAELAEDEEETLPEEEEDEWVAPTDEEE